MSGRVPTTLVNDVLRSWQCTTFSDQKTVHRRTLTYRKRVTNVQEMATSRNEIRYNTENKEIVLWSPSFQRSDNGLFTHILSSYECMQQTWCDR